MQLPGRLGLTTLGDILGALYRARATGVLELVEPSGSSPGRVHRVHLDRGLVFDVETPIASQRLGEILRAQGFIGEPELRFVDRSGAALAGRRIGEWLVAARVVAADVVRQALCLQRRARLEQLFRLRDARIAFRVPRPRPPSDAPALGPNDFLRGRPRRRDGGQPSPERSRRRDPLRERALGALGLDATAGPRDVHRAFRVLAARWHPDRFPNATEAERAELARRFAELSSAYHMLVA